MNVKECGVQCTGGMSVRVLAGNTPSYGPSEEKLCKGLYRCVEDNWHMGNFFFLKQMLQFTLCRSNFSDSVCFWEAKEMPARGLAVTVTDIT